MIRLRDQVQTRVNELDTEIRHYDSKKQARTFTVDDKQEYDALIRERGEVSQRLAELERDERREIEAGKVRTPAPGTFANERRVGGFTVRDSSVYRPDNGTEVSFLRDLYNARRGDWGAADRLQRNNREMRALTTTATDGGEFAPPGHLVELYARHAKASRVFAEVLGPNVLPAGVSSINIPRVSSGTSVAVQAAQNTALSETDLVSAQLTSGIVTIGGKQVVSLQLLNQGGIPVDQVVFDDLSREHAKQIDTQLLTGTGAGGQLKGWIFTADTGPSEVIWTDAAPTQVTFLKKVAELLNKVATQRFLAPSWIVMHPRRWFWLMAGQDTTNRPLTPPVANGTVNSAAVSSVPVAEGSAGSIYGIPVFLDANVPTNRGAGTNEDSVLAGVGGDSLFWESPLRVEAFDATYADSAGVLLRVLNFSAAIPDRQATSLGLLTGTGLVTPTF
ncbi:phage major capsid protein [Rhodococcus daqingensis]|uniref:Phage major capsid protein n=1 Tax=Rhodococcus daqingensis TaxID=2479363 RepID=A0ABW2RV04_9NOCA